MSYERAVLNRFRDFQAAGGEDGQEWTNSPTAKELFKAVKAYELQKELCVQQENRLRVEAKDGEKVLWQTFTKLFTTSSLGLGLNWVYENDLGISRADLGQN